jgi:hypothetical protein
LSSFLHDSLPDEGITYGVLLQLLSEQLAKILSTLHSDDARSGGKERREKPRVGLRATVWVVERGSGAAGTRTTSILRDISREGVGIQHPRKMAIGQRFLMQLPGEEDAIESFLCTVRRCQPVGDNAFQVGATFIRVCDISPKTSARTNDTRSDDEERIRRAILA